jgi:hypothetical protein
MGVYARPTATRNTGTFHLDLVEKLLVVAVDDSLYEDGDKRPKARTILRAAEILGNAVLPRLLQHIEIDPNSDQIDVTWRDRQLGRRIKASFGTGGLFTLYHEQKHQGRVVRYDLLPNATDADLNYWVRWCYGEE